MSKTKKMVILIIVALLIIIPISTMAAMKIINVPILNDTAIEEANKKDTERALAEKAQFAEEHKNDVSTMSEEDLYTEFTQEEKAAFSQEKQEVESKEDKVKSVMNKYYPEDFARILAGIENSNNSNGLVNISDSSVSSFEYQLYDIILKVLEEENLSNEDRATLKESIKTFKSNIEQNDSLNERAERILN